MLELLCRPGAGVRATPGQPLAVLAAGMSLKRSTTHNLLKTLCLCGFAENVGSGCYRAGWKARQLGLRALLSAVEGPATSAALAEISAALGEAAVVAVLLGGQRRVLARTNGTQVIRVNPAAADPDAGVIWQTVTGRVLAAWCAAAELEHVVATGGLPAAEVWCSAATPVALNAALAQVRRAGYAMAEDKAVVSLAVPVLSPEGHLLAALGTYLPSFRYAPDRQAGLLAGLRTGAQRLREILCRGAVSATTEPTVSDG